MTEAQTQMFAIGDHAFDGEDNELLITGVGQIGADEVVVAEYLTGPSSLEGSFGTHFAQDLFTQTRQDRHGATEEG